MHNKDKAKELILLTVDSCKFNMENYNSDSTLSDFLGVLRSRIIDIFAEQPNESHLYHQALSFLLASGDYLPKFYKLDGDQFVHMTDMEVIKALVDRARKDDVCNKCP